MTQPGETAAFTASQHVRALLQAARARVADIAIVNDQLPQRLREAYAVEGQVPVEADVAAVESLGVRVVRASVISETETVRHDSDKLAAVVIQIVDEAVASRASYVKFRPASSPSSSAT